LFLGPPKHGLRPGFRPNFGSVCRRVSGREFQQEFRFTANWPRPDLGKHFGKTFDLCEEVARLGAKVRAVFRSFWFRAATGIKKGWSFGRALAVHSARAVLICSATWNCTSVWGIFLFHLGFGPLCKLQVAGLLWQYQQLLQPWPSRARVWEEFGVTSRCSRLRLFNQPDTCFPNKETQSGQDFGLTCNG
jgi:hypothetical protein